MKKIIGLTGAIGSGKSTVSNYLKEKGAMIIDADKVARQVVAKGEPALNQVVHVFGKDILNTNGNLDRRALGRIVFANEEKRHCLNQLLHPYILKEIEKLLVQFKQNPHLKISVIDAALLFETGLDQQTNQVWYVEADPAVRTNRIMERDGISRIEAEQRISAQPGQDANKGKSHVVLDNNGSINHLKKQIDHYMRKLLHEI